MMPINRYTPLIDNLLPQLHVHGKKLSKAFVSCEKVAVILFESICYLIEFVRNIWFLH